MRIAILVEGKTETPFKPYLLSYLEKRLARKMPKLDFMPYNGRIPTGGKSKRVACDAGAKRLLLPTASVKDLPTIPGELFAKFQTAFYANPVDAVIKALGVQQEPNCVPHGHNTLRPDELG